MKKLIPALCMLLVAAALMGTSTFAWFSMNSRVEASGMEVKATVDDSIFIAAVEMTGTYGVFESTPGTFGVAATLTDVNTGGLKPASTKTPSLTAGNWYQGTAASNDSYVANGDFTALSTLEGFVDAYRVAMYSTAETATAYLSEVTIARTDGTNALNPALRVAFVTDTEIYYVTGAGDGADGAAGKYVTGTAADSLGATTATLCQTGVTAVEDISFDLTGKTEAAPLFVTIFVWYEGQDPACKTDSYSMASMEISMSFVSEFTPSQKLAVSIS